MQVTGGQAIIFGTRMSPEYCLIFMKTNFLDICIRCNMFSGLGAKMVPKWGEGQKGGRVVRRRRAENVLSRRWSFVTNDQ